MRLFTNTGSHYYIYHHHLEISSNLIHRSIHIIPDRLVIFTFLSIKLHTVSSSSDMVVSTYGMIKDAFLLHNLHVITFIDLNRES